MSGFEIGALILGGISGIASAINMYRGRAGSKKQKKMHCELLERLNHIMVPKDSLPPTPHEQNEPIDDVDNYQRLVPYYNKKTGETEFLFEEPIQSARGNNPHNIPMLGIKK
jgi:hypothetical protein